MVTGLNTRARQILQLVIDSYIRTGAPVGSKTISEQMGLTLSSASIRNVMSELEQQGYLYAPHISAGRLPTDAGLTVFVEGMLEINTLSKQDRAAIHANLDEHRSKPVTDKLEEASKLISGLSACAGLVIAPKLDDAVREVEFVKLSDNRVLTVLVHSNGEVENRVIHLKENIPLSSLREAANYLNSFLSGQRLSAIQADLKRRIENDQSELDNLTRELVKAGIAEFSSKEAGQHLIVRGQANLLDGVSANADIERLRHLFAALEEKDILMNVLSAVEAADGVQIYIGSDNSLFKHSGCSLIISPYKDSDKQIIGALGVIGPTRLNYRRVIPVIHYTSELISEFL